MTGFRTIDAQGVWCGESAALDRFVKAYRIDCNGSDETFHRVYKWTPEALQAAKVASGITQRR